ncbi:MAG: hypothetical protein HYV95_17565 [Opitutae bacterium]|nr:hypothetical protein [Opitutae bacterium]
MNSSEPRLQKLPFFIADAVLLLAATALAKFSAQPLDTTIIVIVAVLVIIGAGLIIAPFIIAYVADSREAADRLRDELELQIKRVQAASEGLSRAAAQIKAIEEAVHKSARDAETLPYRMQEKLAEFNEALAEKENEEREALERELEELRAANADQLKAIADKIAKATTDWAALEVATRKQLTGAQDAAAKLDDKLKSAFATLDTKIAELEKALHSAPARSHAKQHDTPAVAAEEKKPEPAAEPVVAPAPTPAAEPAEPLAATPEISVSSEPVASEPPKPKKPRAPRKPKPEDTMMAMSGDSAAEPASSPSVAAVYDRREESTPTVDGGHRPPQADSTPVSVADDSPSEAPAAVEASASSDGATRLLATAYIGIGNKLFIRGDGPGLSWDRGVPMQFVSIGKWGWSTHDAAGPVRIKLYKNDESAALSGEVTLEPGRHTEVTALF